MNIRGHLDLCGYPLIEGWLHCGDAPDRPIRLQVYVGETLIGECVTDHFRKDLQEAGYGSGHCGFSFTVPEEFSALPFADTRLRFMDAPIYLLADQSTVVTGQETTPDVIGIPLVEGTQRRSVAA
jgi:hypothetical protein